MNLEILTPEANVFEGEVTSATFPGVDGTFQILENHAPLLSLLQQGEVRFLSDGKQQSIMIAGGVVEVLTNKVILLADGLIKEETT